MAFHLMAYFLLLLDIKFLFKDYVYSYNKNKIYQKNNNSASDLSVSNQGIRNFKKESLVAE